MKRTPGTTDNLSTICLSKLSLNTCKTSDKWMCGVRSIKIFSVVLESKEPSPTHFNEVKK